MNRRFRSALVFIGIFLALTLVVGSIGLLGSWELLLIAAVAAALTLLVVRAGTRRRPPNGAAP